MVPRKRNRPLLGRFKGIAKGQGSHANPAKRFVWEKEEQRNGRGLYAASGGRDEGCGVCSDANPPLPFSFYRQRLFLCRAKKKGLNILFPLCQPRLNELLQAHEDTELGVIPRQAALEIDRIRRADGAVGRQLDG